MKTGRISLKLIYDFISEHEKECEEGLNLRTALGREYSNRCKEQTSSIPTTQGIYLWGRYKDGRWRDIYLGQAGVGKTANLGARILQELKGERCCLWRAVCSEKKLYELGPRVHIDPKKWPKIRKIWKRAFRKAGSTHIIWATSSLNNKDLKIVEADLIEKLNPPANKEKCQSA